KREGFGHIYVLDSVAEIDAARVDRVKLWNDRREETGPFDIIGDVHGCCDELEALLAKLGYAITRAGDSDGGARYQVTPPARRKAVCVGAIVDRGPRIGDALRLVMDMVDAGHAFCVLGNHESKLERWLKGADVKITHGLDASIKELEAGGEPFKRRVKAFTS